MIGTELISKFIDTIIHTGFLDNDPPQSAMLISSPESGKTSVVQDKNCRSVLTVSDVIGSGLIEELRQKPYLTHLVINDMIAVMSHKQETNQRTYAILSALAEEGLGKILMPGNLSYDFGGKRMGFICCLPSELLSDNRRWWAKTGFMSRFIPFNYEYPESLQLYIKQTEIIPGVYEQRNGKHRMALPNRKFTVTMDKEIAIKVQQIANRVAERLDEKGLRKGKQFRALVRAHALSCKRKEVTIEDVEFLKKISPHMNFSVTKELAFIKPKLETKE